MMDERWLPIEGWPGCSVSNLGHVSSQGKLHTLTERPNGYLVVGLWHIESGAKRTFRVNRLVCEAFHKDTYFEGAYSLHRDHDRSNNKADNLYWGTQQKNLAEMVKAGRDPRGTASGTAKLDWDKVREIRRRAALGEKGSVLGREFGVNTQTVNCVIRGETWKELPSD